MLSCGGGGNGSGGNGGSGGGGGGGTGGGGGGGGGGNGGAGGGRPKSFGKLFPFSLLLLMTIYNVRVSWYIFAVYIQMI